MTLLDERVERVLEMDLTAATELEIIALLDRCFPDTFEGRSYYKQVAHARLLLRRNEILIGHSGLDYRVIRVGDKVVKILGIIDLCVDLNDQHQGRASMILSHAEQVTNVSRAEHMLLFADRTDLYLRNGYQPVPSAMVTWLAIDELASHSVQRRDFSGTLMSKPLVGKPFPEGDIDLLGYLF